MKNEITVTLKFFSGMHRELSLKHYDPGKGITLTVKEGTRLKKALKDLGIRGLSSNAYFRSGERIGLWTKLRSGDEVSCLRPTGGG